MEINARCLPNIEMEVLRKVPHLTYLAIFLSNKADGTLSH